jgi:hypothetical protein
LSLLFAVLVPSSPLASSLNLWPSLVHWLACPGPNGASGRFSLFSWVSLPGALSGRRCYLLVTFL